MRISAVRLFIAVILAGQFIANVDTAIINVATPSIGATLHATGAQLQLTVSGYVLAMSVLLVTAARMGAIFGYGKTFLIGLATFTLASLACGIAPNVVTLIVARVIQGTGAALMVAQVISGIQRMLTGDARTKAIGAYTFTLSLSAICGQLLGGILITANVLGLGWRPLFLINVPLGILLFVLTLRALPREDRAVGPRPTLDFLGVALSGCAMLAFTLPLTIGREMQWPPWTFASLAASFAFAAAFILWQRHLSRVGRSPLLNLALFTYPGIVSGLITQVTARITYFTLLFVLALYVQVGLHETALTSALTLLLWIVCYGIGGPVYPHLPKWIARWCTPFGAFVSSCAFAGVGFATLAGTGTGAPLVLCLGLGGFGFGLLQTALTAHLTSIVPKERASDLSGVIASTVPLATVIGVATYGSAYLILAAGGSRAAATHAFATVNFAFSATAALGIISAVVTILRGEGIGASGKRARDLDLVQNVDRNRDVGVA